MIQITLNRFKGHYEVAKYPSGAGVIYRQSTILDEKDLPDQRDALVMEWVPTADERRVLAEGGHVMVVMPDVDSPPETHVSVSAPGDLVQRSLKEGMIVNVARQMWAHQPGIPPVDWDEAPEAAKQLYLTQAGFAVSMVVSALNDHGRLVPSEG